MVLKAMKELHEKVLALELETIGAEKKVQHDRVFNFSIMKSLSANKGKGSRSHQFTCSRRCDEFSNHCELKTRYASQTFAFQP